MHKLIALVIAALLVGAAIGISYQLPVRVETFTCSVDTPTVNTPPCPPDDDRVVWATWDPGVRTPARWDGTRWTFVQPILGQRSTMYHPSNWGEL